MEMARIIQPIRSLLLLKNYGGISKFSTTTTDQNEPNSAVKKVSKPRKPRKPKEAKKLDAEAERKANTVKILHKINKDMFGGLLETNKERAKRLRDEKKLAKSKSFDIDPTNDGDENELEYKPKFYAKRPNLLPKGARVILPGSHQLEKHNFSKEAEINWVLTMSGGNLIAGEFNAENLFSPRTTIVFKKKEAGQGKSNNEKSVGDEEEAEVPGEVEQQFLNTFPERDDTSPKSELNVVKKGGDDVPEVDEDSDPFDTVLDQPPIIIKNSKDENKAQSKLPQNVANVVNVRKFHNLLSKSLFEKEQPSTSSNAIAPYINPERADQDQDQSRASSIISLPFPRYSNNFNAAPGEKPAERFPSVSRILDATMSEERREILAKWEAKMIAELGEEGFKSYKESLFSNGHMLHSNIESYLRGTALEEISIAPTITGHWDSIRGILPRVQSALVVESHVSHPLLKYCGIVDAVALYKNKLVLIDWKTSQKPKPLVSMTYDTPLQIAAYIGAINYDPNYTLKVTEGLIVIAYEDGKSGHTFLLNSSDIARYWEKWNERLQLYYSLENSSKA